MPVGSVNTELNSALAGRDPADQAGIDQLMIELDGSDNKARLGANALLAVSLANAKAHAFCKRAAALRAASGPARLCRYQ